MLFLSSPAEHQVFCMPWACSSPMISWGLISVSCHWASLSAGRWGRGRAARGRAPAPTMSRAAPPCRAARCPPRRWGARLLMTALWARSPTSWWSHGLTCTSVKSAAPWAIPAPEVSLGGQVGGCLWWGEKGEVCVGHWRWCLYCHSWDSFSIAPGAAGCAFSLCHPCPIPLLFFLMACPK